MRIDNPLLTTPASGNLVNCTGLPLSGLAPSGATTSQVCTWNGSAWVPATPGGLPSIANNTFLANTSGSSAVPVSTGAVAARTALELGTLATQSGTFSGTSSGTNTGDQDLSGFAPLSSPTLTGVPTAPTAATATNTTQLATTAFVQTVVTNADTLRFVGVLNCSTNPDYPAANAGHLYRVSVAGKIGGASGPNVEINDTLYCTTDNTASGDHAAVGSNWVIVQANIDGAVVGPVSSTDNRVVFFDGATGKLIKDSGLTLSGTNTGDQTNIAGNAATVTTNANLTGHVTSVGNATVLGSFTKSQLDVAVTDGNVLYVGDVTSNVDHTGDVTGSTTLTIATGVVTIAKLSATGTPNSTTFLRGDGVWGTPAGGGGGGSGLLLNTIEFFDLTYRYFVGDTTPTGWKVNRYVISSGVRSVNVGSGIRPTTLSAVQALIYS